MMIKQLVFLLLLLPFTLAIVWNPTITTPNAATKWRAGQSYTVKWETTVLGEEIPDGVKGTIYLGYLEGDDYNEHLNWKLASNFALNKGSQRITLPSDLPTRNSYIIVVMGDSGNASAKFRISAQRA
ncbi:hypothetical protein BX666DRAFT_1897114 [Dichotomocladium elegans]|nr:hypothetical protein BX666DRAFT_1897114 [Dichotomocladium elegans]